MIEQEQIKCAGCSHIAFVLDEDRIVTAIPQPLILKVNQSSIFKNPIYIKCAQCGMPFPDVIDKISETEKIQYTLSINKEE